MTKKPEESPSPRGNSPQMNWRWYWVRTVLITVLMFVFIVYLMQSRGVVAYVWAAVLSLATLGYFVYSYFKLRD